MKERKTLKDYMTPSQRKALGDEPTWHKHCFAATGVSRPGKTARERAKKRSS